MGLCNNRIVVKVGTSTLTNDAGKSDLRAIDRLVRNGIGPVSLDWCER